MAGEGGSLIVAAIGVGGTLAASLIGQVATLRSRSIEIRARRAESVEDRHYAELRRTVDERKSVYVALLTAAREERFTMRAWILAIRDSADEPKLEAAETTSRTFTLRYRECYTAATLIVPPNVLRHASEMDNALISARSMTRRLSAERLDSGDSIEAALDHLDAAQDRLLELRQAIRIDLGVDTETNNITLLDLERRKPSRTA